MASNRCSESDLEQKKGNRLSLKRSFDEISTRNVSSSVVVKQDSGLGSNQSISGKIKEKRKANWTGLETKTLIMQVMENYEMINANHGGSMRIETQKKQTWNDIVDMVNR